MVGRYCNYQRILTDCNSQFPLYIFVRLAAKCEKPVFSRKLWSKFTLLVHRFFRQKTALKLKVCIQGNSQGHTLWSSCNFFSPYFCWTCFGHFSWAGIAFFNLARWCSKGILGNSLILWAENASYPHFKVFFKVLGHPVLLAKYFVYTAYLHGLQEVTWAYKVWESNKGLQGIVWLQWVTKG